VKIGEQIETGARLREKSDFAVRQFLKEDGRGRASPAS
jgi:hypothetical protein